MGQVTKAEVIVHIHKDKEIPLGITSKTAVEQSMLNHYRELNPNSNPNPSIIVTHYENFENECIEIHLYSGRRPNLDFQSDLLESYLETIKGDVIESVEVSVWGLLE